jgi:branched-chain amino acid transport system permease protein
VPAFLAAYDFLLVSMVLAAVLALSLYVPLDVGPAVTGQPGLRPRRLHRRHHVHRIFPTAGGLYPVSLVILEMVVAALASPPSSA